MITSAQRAIVSSTVPLLEQGGEALTTHFYRLQLAEHPELRPFFNQAHQASGAQPRALANGVLMYAKNIDRLEAMGPLASQIVHKHVALQVMPAHYPIVGACLLRAIREVLGAELATDEVIDAWAAAYGQLAEILIGAEQQLYDAQGAAPGGWRGTREFTVLRKVRESAEISSFHLAPTDGGALSDFAPGQYIGLQLEVDGTQIRRHYSLSAAPNGRTYRISVKREAGGVASNHLHDQVQEGDTLLLLPPSGDFVLGESARPLVLISGGVGITPTLAMLEQALAAGREVVFIHCARHGEVHAFREQVESAAARHPQLRRFYSYDEAGTGTSPAPHAVGRLDIERLNAWLPMHTRDVDAYFLGPKPFMQQVRRGLRAWGVPDAQARFEFFGPASALE
ncbi:MULTISPECIES: NO-inducible flavohemoprotein [unclassified Variovorax]|uniref:NO-inducible flavohemoprotein n=1 Tax=unclassified Variovorax TaxID=663243 RepID=UPI002576F02A|nr:MULTISPECIES: NO-inducible flavohemoprotein [unclassified Variovorax]MDM0089320.1 NO-inducible flavohemoprotein [Variovorax sp. J22G40]MDM0147393.1 NO-inducible flavohemoprotein [Variovorax sp. J2P1-31]